MWIVLAVGKPALKFVLILIYDLYDASYGRLTEMMSPSLPGFRYVPILQARTK